MSARCAHAILGAALGLSMLTKVAGAQDCGAPVCQADPETLLLPRIITFDDQPSGWDPGRLVDEILVLEGARFAEHFAGQSVQPQGVYDVVDGDALGPLLLIAGQPGQTLSVVRMFGSNILNGFGPQGYPAVGAQGEGAIAVLFDHDQSEFAFDLLGGEGGEATLTVLARTGQTLGEVHLRDLKTEPLGFVRQGGSRDIAGFVLTNQDPQGIAIDNLRFGVPPELG